MMKARSLLASLTLLFTAAAVCSAANPQAGVWKLNEGKSELAPGMGKNLTVTYTEKGDNMKVAVEGVDKDGKPFKSIWKGKFDGKAYPVKGHPTYDMMMYKTVNDHTNEITAMKAGKTIWTGTITVAADGKSRVVDVSGTDADGKKFKSKAFYDKQ